MTEWNQWYVCVDDTTVGPVSTELVVRGIEHRKIPLEALVCAVGATTWLSMSSIEAFHAAVIRSYPPPPPESEEARYWVAKGFRFPKPAPLPRLAPLPAPKAPPPRESGVAYRSATSSDVAIDVDWCETPRSTGATDSPGISSRAKTSSSPKRARC